MMNSRYLRKQFYKSKSKVQKIRNEKHREINGKFGWNESKEKKSKVTKLRYTTKRWIGDWIRIASLRSNYWRCYFRDNIIQKYKNGFLLFKETQCKKNIIWSFSYYIGVTMVNLIRCGYKYFQPTNKTFTRYICPRYISVNISLSGHI